jgi:5,5'-dehydrodivanillate O-demethylase oxygenase subunit
MAFRCAHRGTQLSTGWVEGDNIRCFYHGWMYGPDGQCLEQPAEPEPFCQRIRIKSYPVQEYLGLIFAYLGDAPVPELPRYPDLEDEGILETSVYTWPCSYFNSLENGHDHVHIAFVHRDLRAELGLVGVPRVAAEETDWGILHTAVRPDGGVRNILNFWPNMNRRKSGPPFPDVPWTEAMAWRVPVDDTHFSSFGVNLVHVTGEQAEGYREIRAAERAKPMTPATVASEAVMRGELRVWDVEDRRILNGVQDYTAQVGQGAIPDRSAWHLASSDVAVVLLRNVWYRELRALAEGRPLKEWKHPHGVAPTTGLA